MIRWLFLLCSLTCTALSADLEDHFKKPADKSGNHQLRNIDFIYMINLDQRPEKFAASAANLAPYGVFPYRFSAVNGWELSLETINDIGVKYGPWMKSGPKATYYPLEGDGRPCHEVMRAIGRAYFCHTLSRGAIGIILSHLSILQDAYDSGYETIWVMEDDVEVVRDPGILSDLIGKLDDLVGKDGWDILFTDRDTKNGEGTYVQCSSFAWRPNFTPSDPDKFALKQDISPDFRRIGARYGAYSMIVRRSGMEKLLDFFKNYCAFLPYDMDFIFPTDMHMFTVIDDVVSTQPRAVSDNGAPNYKYRAP